MQQAKDTGTCSSAAQGVNDIHRETPDCGCEKLSIKSKSSLFFHKYISMRTKEDYRIQSLPGDKSQTRTALLRDFLFIAKVIEQRNIWGDLPCSFSINVPGLGEKGPNGFPDGQQLQI